MSTPNPNAPAAAEFAANKAGGLAGGQQFSHDVTAGPAGRRFVDVPLQLQHPEDYPGGSLWADVDAGADNDAEVNERG